MDIYCDAVVVGAGIVGALIASRLADAGMDVVCLGEDIAAPGRASSAAGAMLGVLGEVVSGDGPLDAEELSLRDQAARLWPATAEWLTTTSGIPVKVGQGTFIIAGVAKQSDRACLAAMDAAADKLGLACEEIDPREIPYLSPAPGYETIEARWLPAEGYVDTTAVASAVRATLSRLRYVEGLAIEVQHEAGHVSGVTTTHGVTLRADTVILAAGVGTQALLDALGDCTGVTARLLPGKGTSVTLADDGNNLRQVIRTPNRDFACGTHLVPRGDGSLYLGATNRIAATPGSNESSTSGELHTLLHSGCHEINTRLRTAECLGFRYGMRPLSSDGYPLIGPTNLDGLYLATGTYRNGILLAPAIAGLITAAVLDPPASPPVFAPTSPWRINRPVNLQRLLQIGVPQIVSFVTEPGGHLPYDRQNELQRALLTLFRLAFLDSDDEALAVTRQRCDALLRSGHVPETITQVFYELSAAALP